MKNTKQMLWNTMYNSIRIGTDVVAIARIKKLGLSSKATQNIFTQYEVYECKQKENPYASLAARFAAKEAIQKCLEENIRYNTIEIRTGEMGKPEAVFLHARLQKKYKVRVSISHTKTIAQAVCLVIKTKE